MNELPLGQQFWNALGALLVLVPALLVVILRRNR